MLRVRIHPHILLTNQPIQTLKFLPETLPPIVFPSFSKKVATLRNSAKQQKHTKACALEKSRGFFLFWALRISAPVIKDFRYLRWRNLHLYELYGYGLCKGKLKTACIFGSGFLHFWWPMKLLSKTRQIKAKQTNSSGRCPKILDGFITWRIIPGWSKCFVTLIYKPWSGVRPFGRSSQRNTLGDSL